jgi:hypothetical protein
MHAFQTSATSNPKCLHIHNLWLLPHKKLKTPLRMRLPPVNNLQNGTRYPRHRTPPTPRKRTLTHRPHHLPHRMFKPVHMRLTWTIEEIFRAARFAWFGGLVGVPWFALFGHFLARGAGRGGGKVFVVGSVGGG